MTADGKPAAPRCPYCWRPAELTDGAELYVTPEARAKKFWVCRPCDARVGCHPGGTRPLGPLADRALREARQRAHAAFDPIWRNAVAQGLGKNRARTAAYAWLAERLGTNPRACHIAHMDVAACHEVVRICGAWSPQPATD